MRPKSAHQLLELATSCFTHSRTKQLHAALITAHDLSPQRSSSLATKLLRSYAANDDILSAQLLFDQALRRSVLLWNSIIRAHAKRHDFARAFSLFTQMRGSNINPDGHTFACVLRACSENSDSFGARMVHAAVLVSGFGSDRITSSALVSAYVKLGLVEEAGNVFNGMRETDLVLWNALIMGYGYHRLRQKGLEMFHRLRDSGEKPDGYTLVGVISCLWDPSSLPIGKGVHGLCLKGGCGSSDHVKSALVSMYSRCMCLESAYRAFVGLSKPDLVMWTAIITGFSQAGKSNEALRLFREMVTLGKRPDQVLIAGVLSACASLATVEPCKEIHSYVFRLRIDADIQVSCALIDAYGKCGFAKLGLQVFSMMQEKSLVAYNSVILGLGSHGLGHKAIELFEEMLDDGLKPDKATFSALLCACCHSGLGKDGQSYFKRMKCEFSLEPQMEHYVYMVKLLGAVGALDEAYGLIQAMPVLPDSGVWGALLWGCCVHGCSDLGEIAVEKLYEIEPKKTSYRVMLSNIYASEKKWEDVKNLRDDILEEGLQKVPGLSWIGGCSL